MERLTEHVNVLSWDCGLSNISFCLLEHTNGPEREFRVVLWEVFSLNEHEVTNAVASLVTNLEKRPWMMQADHVAIEAQVHKNPVMKIIAHSLQTYFLTKSRATQEPHGDAVLVSRQGPRVHFIAPQNKFKVCNVAEPTQCTSAHLKNKKLAVAMCEKMLAKQKDRAALDYLHSHKKQDDLADSFLQALYFLRSYAKKKQVNRHLQGLLGAPKEIVIQEHRETEKNTDRFVYQAENFSLPAFDVDGASVAPSIRLTSTNKVAMVVFRFFLQLFASVVFVFAFANAANVEQLILLGTLLISLVYTDRAGRNARPDPSFKKCALLQTADACASRGAARLSCELVRSVFDTDAEWARYRRNSCLGVSTDPERLLFSYHPDQCAFWGACSDECKTVLQKINQEITVFACNAAPLQNARDVYQRFSDASMIFRK